MTMYILDPFYSSPESFTTEEIIKQRVIPNVKIIPRIGEKIFFDYPAAAVVKMVNYNFIQNIIIVQCE